MLDTPFASVIFSEIRLGIDADKCDLIARVLFLLYLARKCVRISNAIKYGRSIRKLHTLDLMNLFISYGK